MYKHLDGPEALPFLLRGYLKFTPIAELNDPSELLPQVDVDDLHVSLTRLRSEGYSESDLSHLRRQDAMLKRFAPIFQAIGAPESVDEANRIIRSSFFDLLPPLLALLELTAAEISKKVGVLCLTRRFDSLPMWAHYSKNGAGLVIEFTGLQEIFQGDETGILRQLVPVRYDRERRGVTFDPQSHETIFFGKFRDWGYEKESRVILPLEECRTVEAGDRSLFLYDIPPRHVRRLILGWRMPPPVVERVEAMVADLNPSVPVCRVGIEKGAVRLLA